jgi:predicted metalloprotease
MADRAPPPTARPRRLLRLAWPAIGGLILAMLLLALADAGAIPAERVKPIASPAVLDGADAARLARRISAAHADVGAIWRHNLKWRHGRAYEPPDLVLFSGRRFGPCAGARGVSGVVYCPLDRTLSADLAFLETLLATLPEPRDRFLLLLVARATAIHLQAELAILGDADRMRTGLDREAAAALDREIRLQADCLAGVAAKRARRSLGPLPEGSWSTLVEAVRTVSPEAADALGLDGGAAETREHAFAAGYDGGEIRDCLTPALAGILG